MSAPPGIWRERIITDADATTEEQLSDIVPDGDRWYIRRIAVMNNTTLNSDAVVYIKTATHDHMLHIFTELPINRPETEDLGCWLREGEQILVSWSGVASGDRLTTDITGVKRYGRGRGSMEGE